MLKITFLILQSKTTVSKILHSFANSNDRDALGGAETLHLSTVCWPDWAVNVKDKRRMSSAEMNVYTPSFIRMPRLSKYNAVIHACSADTESKWVFDQFVVRLSASSCIVKFQTKQSSLGSKNDKWCVLPPNQSWVQWISRSNALCPWIPHLWEGRKEEIMDVCISLQIRLCMLSMTNTIWQISRHDYINIEGTRDGVRQDAAVERRLCSYRWGHEGSKCMWTTPRCHAECVSLTMRCCNGSTAACWDLSPH